MIAAGVLIAIVVVVLAASGAGRSSGLRRVRDESAFTGERRLQPGDHRVEGVRELLEFVARPGEGDPLVPAWKRSAS